MNTLHRLHSLALGLSIGAYAMVGMGSVVTRDVPPHGLVFGNPARLRGSVCICGQPRTDPKGTAAAGVRCARCGQIP